MNEQAEGYGTSQRKLFEELFEWVKAVEGPTKAKWWKRQKMRWRFTLVPAYNQGRMKKLRAATASEGRKLFSCGFRPAAGERAGRLTDPISRSSAAARIEKPHDLLAGGNGSQCPDRDQVHLLLISTYPAQVVIPGSAVKRVLRTAALHVMLSGREGLGQNAATNLVKTRWLEINQRPKEAQKQLQ